MTIIEAVLLNRPLTRKDKTWYYISRIMGVRMAIKPNTFIDRNHFFDIIPLTPEDILANDWIVMDHGEDFYEKD